MAQVRSKPMMNMAADPYQAESDFGTLQRGHEIRGDKARHKAALAHGKKKLKATQAVIDDAEDNPQMGGDSGVDEAAENKNGAKLGLPK